MAGSARAELDGELAAEADLMRASLRQAYWARTMDFLGALEDLGEALSSLGGRKQVVLLSGGFSDAWQDVRDVSNSPIWQRMADLFRGAGRSDMVIHSIDLSGLAPPPGSSLSGISSGAPVRDIKDSSWDWRPNPGRATLAALAENTGGRYVYPTNDFARALNEVDEISRRYYILAFQPVEASTKPDRDRKLRVRVHGSGLKVSHRASYVLPASWASAPGTSAQHLRAAEALAKGLSGGSLGLHVTALPYRDRQGGASVPAVLHVDGATLPASGRRDASTSRSTATPWWRAAWSTAWRGASRSTSRSRGVRCGAMEFEC